nr:M1 family metallopeptidase [Maliibacterium massiliense]
MRSILSGTKKARTIALAIGVIVLLAVVITAVAAVPAQAPRRAQADFRPEGAPEELTRYELDLIFDPNARTLTGQMRLDFFNTTQSVLADIGLHLYPNAFAQKDTAPFAPEEWTLAYPDGFSPGYIDIQRVCDEAGNPLAVTYGAGERPQMMYVQLPAPLESGGRSALRIDYTVRIPNCYGRFGYGARTFDLAQAYPMVSVYENGAWRADDYASVGDPFYSEMADFRVCIAAPAAYTLATSGDCVAEQTSDGVTYRQIAANAVRDFVLIASDQMRLYTKQVGDVLVQSYGWDLDGTQRALDVAASALALFSERFGAYPYRQLSVVQSDFFIGGMEYPNLVQIDEMLYQSRYAQTLETVVAHEVAHQWWYQLVGSDEVRAPWLDEALTQYSTVLYYRLRYGQQRESAMWVQEVNMAENLYLAGRLGPRVPDDAVDLAITSYPNNYVYSALVYSKGALLWRDVEREMGEETFKEALRIYFARMRYQNATPQNLYDALQEAAGRDMAPSVRSRLRTGQVGGQAA